MFRLHDGYSPLVSSPPKGSEAHNHNEKGAPHHPKNSPSLVTLFLLCFGLGVSLLTAGGTVHLLYNAKTGPQFVVSISPGGGIAPPGTLGFRLERDPVQSSGNSANVTFIGPSGTIALNVDRIGPSVISRFKRSTPFESFPQPSYRLAEEIVLTYDDYAILQFGELDSSKHHCVIAALRSEPMDERVKLLSPHTSIQVWNVSQSTPLALQEVTYIHRPPRRNYLGDVDFRSGPISLTETFVCPQQGWLTVEVKCQQWNGCEVQFQQEIASQNHGIHLLQWND